jgi:hypothetical protein
VEQHLHISVKYRKSSKNYKYHHIRLSLCYDPPSFMKTMNYHIDYRELGLGFDEVASYMGYFQEDVPSPIDHIIFKSLEDADDYCNIQGGLVICDDISLDQAKKSIRLPESEFFIKGRLFNEIKDSEKMAFFVCTAGSEISRISKRLIDQKDLLTGYVFDVIGSLVVEKGMDKIQIRFGKAMNASGYQITNRYSPGYCGWQTSEQFKLFKIFPENFCGVRLTESALMDPIKSISGIIGIGAHVEFREYACELCDAVNCIYRNKRIKNPDQ